MKRGALLTGIVTVGVLVLASAPARAMSLFGFSFGDSTTAPESATTQQTDTGIGDQAANFLNDIVDNADENTCLAYKQHEYEVCSAYIFNSSMADLVPYYKYANSTNGSMARFVSYRLGSRYTENAETLIRDRVGSWPNGTNEVDVPRIKILSVNSNLSTNTAMLRTRETWLVSDQQHQTIYREDGVYHTITMKRVQSYLLHKWVVTDIE